jgi:hypothetical protein
MRNVLLSLALTVVPAFGAVYANGYAYCEVVTTSYTMVSGTADLSGYPLTVILPADSGRQAHVQNSSGYDIVFDNSTSCSGSGTALTWDLESYTAATGALVAHLLRTTLSHTANDVVSMYYGKSGITTFQSTASAVWNSNYKGVWHMGESTLTAHDSTANANNPTTLNGATTTAGAVGAGALIGSSYISVPHSTSLDITSGAITVEMWIKPATAAEGTYSHLYSKIGTEIYYNSGGTTINLHSYAPPNGQWSHIAYTLAYPTRVSYFNGSGYSENTYESAGSNTAPLLIGGNGATPVFVGAVDEVRVSDIVRSAGWIATEYRNMSAPGTYISVGAEQSPSGKILHQVRGGM